MKKENGMKMQIKYPDKEVSEYGKTVKRLRYYWRVLIIILVFFTIIAFCVSRIISHRLRPESYEHYQLLANDTAGTINSWLASKKEILLNQRISLEMMGDYSREHLTSFLENTIKGRNDTDEICDLYFIDKDGVLSTANGYYTDYDLRNRDYYKLVLYTREIYFTSPYRDISTGSYIVTMSASCKNPDGSIAGVLALDIYIDAFLDPVRYTNVPDDSYIFLIDSNYGLASHPNEDFGYVDERPRILSDLRFDIYHSVKEEIEKKEFDMVNLRDYDGVERDMFISDISSCDWCVVAAISDAELKSSERLMVGYTIAALFITLSSGIIWTLFGAKKMMDQLNDAIGEANAANEAKSIFLANMSHEIRTPINTILGMNEIIARDIAEADDMISKGQDINRDMLDDISVSSGNILNAGNSLLTIINDVLDFSKIEAGKMEITKGEYSLGSVLNDVSNAIYFRAKEKGLEFIMYVDEMIPDRLYGDEFRLRRIMLNLLGNALKFTDEGNIRLTVEKKSREDKDGEYDIDLLIKVRDTGIGIKREDLDKLFNKFERLDMKRNSSIEGAGLGLPITKNLLELMDGTIKVESEYGKGSIFMVSVPQKVISPEPVGDFREKFRESIRSETKGGELFTAPDALILAVDDTTINLKVIKGLLKRTKIRIDTANGGREAVELTETKKYDIILMDQRMPDLDGEETMKCIRGSDKSLNKDTCFICLTADAVNGAKERYLNKGFDDYLAKPVDGTELERKLLKYLPADKIRERSGEEEGKNADTGSKEAGRNNDLSTEEASELQSVYEEKVILADDKEEALKVMFENAGIDYGEGLKNCMKDIELYRDILLDYEKSYDSLSEKMEMYCNNKDLNAYEVLVHSLKSSSRVIGADHLSELAFEQENRAKNGDLEKVIGGSRDMMETYGSVVDCIRSAFIKGLLREG
ncbi:MAG: response regulator [Lachnospiraceae bacterium]|nr:response regulator [Lachnospiraceae bacterium]